MGQTWVDVDFQVIDIPTSYNLLLGQPWIHAAGAVASTLHQVVKFEWNHKEVIIHSDGSNPIYSYQTILAIKGRRRLGGETYHHIERVNAIDKDKWWDNKIESILNWSGYEPGKGLSKNLQGSSKPIKLKKHGTTFGLGYDYTWEEFNNWFPSWSDTYYPLEQPIPHLEQTFQKADIVYGLDKEEALAVVKNLFMEDNDMDCCVVLKEKGEEGPSIQAEDINKQIKTKVLRIVEYPTWLADSVSVPKKDGKVRVYVDYRDLNQIWMDEEDAEKTAFITPWGMYCYKMMSFSLKNVGAPT
ncbi:uncharacterized protein [Nicotiana sylvestris]|uniref:uncharacterized protein n=1 Tax=Nicotiana sylvestris TaxID=4096 RepID=UPI00388CE267